MASRSGSRRALRALAFFVVIVFILDVGLLIRVLKEQRRLAAGDRAGAGRQAEPPTNNQGQGADEIRAAFSALSQEHAALQTEADALRAKVKQLDDEGAALRQTVETRFADHEALRSEAAGLRGRLADAEEALAVSKNDLAVAGRSVTDLEAKVKAAADLVAKLNADVKTAKDRADGLAADLKAAREAAAAEKQRADDLQKSLDEANATLEAAKKLIDKKTKEAEDLKARVAALEKQLADAGAAGPSGGESGQ
jgi:chromosome segregation ATPase